MKATQETGMCAPTSTSVKQEPTAAIRMRHVKTQSEILPAHVQQGIQVNFAWISTNVTTGCRTAAQTRTVTTQSEAILVTAELALAEMGRRV